MNENINKNYQYSIITILVLFLGLASFSVYNFFNNSVSSNQITVSGTFSKDINNQIATFTINTNGEDANKEKAETINSNKVNKVKEAIKQFNIDEKDITTQNYSSYRKIEYYTENGISKSRETNWVFNQSIRITIKDISKVNEIVKSLNATESEIVGPSYSLDIVDIDDKEVYVKAFEKAKEKAENLANSSGRKLGRVVNIVESSTSAGDFISVPMLTRQGGGGAGGPEIPAGSSKIQKTLIVIFELK